MLAALATAPDADAERILGDMARRDPHLLGEYEWLNAVLGRGTESACLMLIDSACGPNAAGSEAKVDGWTIATKLAEFVGTRPAVRAELVRRYEDPTLAACHPLIEQVLAKSPDASAVLAMVRNYAAKKREFDWSLHSTIEEVALEKKPVSGSPNSYELHPAAVPELRKELFAFTAGGGNEAVLAAACLTAIDELRDEHGRVEDEPRHPDIASGRPWPLQAEVLHK